MFQVLTRAQPGTEGAPHSALSGARSSGSSSWTGSPTTNSPVTFWPDLILENDPYGQRQRPAARAQYGLKPVRAASPEPSRPCFADSPHGSRSLDLDSCLVNLPADLDCLDDVPTAPRGGSAPAESSDAVELPAAFARQYYGAIGNAVPELMRRSISMPHRATPPTFAEPRVHGLPPPAAPGSYGDAAPNATSRFGPDVPAHTRPYEWHAGQAGMDSRMVGGLGAGMYYTDATPRTAAMHGAYEMGEYSHFDEATMGAGGTQGPYHGSHGASGTGGLHPYSVGSDGRPPHAAGSWRCLACGNSNYAWRESCNLRRCNTPRPAAFDAGVGQHGPYGLPQQLHHAPQQQISPQVVLAAAAKKPFAPPKLEPGDWTCSVCENLNYSFRSSCNMRKCGAPRPPSGAGPTMGLAQELPPLTASYFVDGSSTLSYW